MISSAPETFDSAILFYPSTITALMNLVSVRLPYTGSGSVVRFRISRRRAIMPYLCPSYFGFFTPYFERLTQRPACTGLPPSSVRDAVPPMSP